MFWCSDGHVAVYCLVLNIWYKLWLRWTNINCAADSQDNLQLFNDTTGESRISAISAWYRTFYQFKFNKKADVLIVVKSI